MSHTRLKTTYKESGIWGSVVEKTVYADYNNSCDIVTFYDDDGNVIFSIEDTLAGNLLEAIMKIYEGDEDKFERWMPSELPKTPGDTHSGEAEKI